jgi:aspartyl-tRNA(Asn)/glutamyl-tRNA(Gln) amidotransferase subunit A
MSTDTASNRGAGTEAELPFGQISDLALQIRNRRISPVEIVESMLVRIEQLNGVLKAFVHLDGERALAAASAAEIEIGAGGYRGPLHGIPYACKDIVDVQDMPTTSASRVMLGHVADRDSTVAARLRQAGAICLGKLNTQEFASGSMELFGDTRNPWDTNRTSGGSSAGSAAAPAAGLVSFAVGTDTGGSIRMPASFCGLVGLKPTYGRVSRAGIVPLSWSMDHPGLLARTVTDVAMSLQAVAGSDVRDRTAASVPVLEYADALQKGIGVLRVGIPRAYFFEGGDPEVVAAVRAAIDVMRRSGATLVDVDLPHAESGQAVAWAIAFSEALTFHRSTLEARSHDYGRMFVRKVATAAFLTADELVAAHKLRQAITAEFTSVLQQVDVVVTPTNLYPAHAVGTMLPNQARPRGIFPEGDLTLLGRPVSLTGLPAVSVPCGFTHKGLPVGVQLIGRSFEEATLLRLAFAYEQAAGWWLHRPPITSGEVEPLSSPLEASADPIDAQWVRQWSNLARLSYISEDDFGPIAMSVAPLKAQLRQSAKAVTRDLEPAVRPAPSFVAG